MIEEIYDMEMYKKYIQQVAKIVENYHGEYLARSNKVLPFMGAKPERAIVIAFDSVEEAQGCFFSEEYEKIKHLREDSTQARAFFIENDG